MPTLTPSTDFTAVFRVSGDAPTLTLTNIGTYPVSILGMFRVTMPSLAVREISAAPGTAMVINLPLATDGTAQKGVYSISLSVKEDDVSPTYSDGIVTRPFPLSFNVIQPKIGQEIDYSIPKIVYVDSADYRQAGFDAPTVARSWAANATETGPFTSNASVLDLIQAGVYYDALYTLSVTITATYTHPLFDWVTVIATVVVPDFIDVKALPAWEVIEDWVLQWQKKNVEKCGCAGSDCEEAKILGLLNQIKMLACSNRYSTVAQVVYRLYSLTHYGVKYNPVHSGAILQAVDLCGSIAAIPCPPAATSLTFTSITATTAVINFTGSTIPYYDLLLTPTSGSAINLTGVVNGQTLTGLPSSTAFTGKLTTRCTTGTGNFVTGAFVTTSASFKLANPAPAAINVLHTSAGWAWPAITGGNSYVTELYSNSGMTTLVDTKTTSSLASLYTSFIPGQILYLRQKAVDTTGVNQDSDWVNFTITTYANLSITTQPSSQVITDNGNTSFTAVFAGGVTPVTYQWKRVISGTPSALTNGGVYSGATSATLAITAGTLSMNGYTYRCTATDADGHTIDTEDVTLTVNAAVVNPPATNVYEAFDSLQFNITPPVNAATIELRVSDDATFPTGGTTSVSITSLGAVNHIHEVSGLNPNTIHYYEMYTTAPGLTNSTTLAGNIKTFKSRINSATPGTSGCTIATINSTQAFDFEPLVTGSTTVEIMDFTLGGTPEGNISYLNDYRIPGPAKKCAFKDSLGVKHYNISFTDTQTSGIPIALV